MGYISNPTQDSELTYGHWLYVFCLPSKHRDISYNAQLKSELVAATFPTSLQSLYVAFFLYLPLRGPFSHNTA